MAAREDAMDLVFRFRVQIFGDRLIVQERDRVLGIRFDQWEEIAHGFDGDEDARVGAVIAVASDFCDYANDIEINAVQQNR